MLPNNTFKQSIHNFIDKISENENEDAMNYIVSKDFDKIAVSDGAGGAGIYCKSWAEHLVKNQPDNPFVDEVTANEWFLKNSESFYKENIETINKMDSFIIEKFIKEGSYATLVFVWWNKLTNILHYSGVGDTTLFVFRKNITDYKPILITPIDVQNSLDDFPKLLNWNKEINFDLTAKEIELRIDDIILICTDSIARWIIYYLIILDTTETQKILGDTIFKNIDKDKLESIKLSNQFKNLSELLFKLKNTVNKSEPFFKKELEKQINLDHLEKDDFTIIFKCI
jgi:hypothetical protein